MGNANKPLHTNSRTAVLAGEAVGCYNATVRRDGTLRQAANRVYGQYWAVPLGFNVSYQATRSWVHDYHGTIGWLR